MCCGRNATSASVTNRTYISARPTPPAPTPTRPAEFEYTGATALTVVSPITGRKYRFLRPGARLHVDAMDRQWIAFVPHLKRCS
jgi:hypothetical protein